ncbi:MAG TPA: DUF1707 domain-containing protein [Actinocrinis sp.]|jgi:hypothetical protein
MDKRDQTRQNAAEPDPYGPRDAVPEDFAPTRADRAAGMIRTSDAERDEALRVLATHYAAGRLETAEFDARAGAALAARTRAELRRLFADLPGGAPGRTPQYQQPDRRPYRPGPGGLPAPGWRLTVLAAVLLVAALGAVRHGYFPVPLIPALFILSRRPWRWNRKAEPWT